MADRLNFLMVLFLVAEPKVHASKAGSDRTAQGKTGNRRG